MFILIAAVLLCVRLSAQAVGQAQKPVNPAVEQWKTRAQAIRNILSSDQYCQTDEDEGIVDAFGVNQGDLSVALVACGHGGAYSESMVVLVMKQGRPVVAAFRDSKGEHVENGFLTGASVMHSVNVKLVQEKRAIYDEFADNGSDGKLEKCGVKAYVWNVTFGTFDLDRRLSKAASDQYCRLVQGHN